MTHKKHIRSALYLGLTVISILAGFIGGLFSQSGNDIEDISQVNLNQPPAVYIDRTKIETGRSDLEKAGDTFAPIVFRFYEVPPKVGVGNALQLTDLRFLGYGVSLTADGWLVTSAGISGSVLAVDYHGTYFQIQKKIPDLSIGVTYVKIPSTQLKTVSFEISDPSRIQSGMLVRAVRDVAAITLSNAYYIFKSDQKDAVQSTLKLAKLFHSSSEIQDTGLPVISQRGLIGITTHGGIIPSEYLQNSFASLLKNGFPQRSPIEINYIDLSSGIMISPEVSPQSFGALVVGRVPALNISTDSGVFTLSQGDIIVSINDEMIDVNRSLSEVLSGYHSGDTLKIKIKRKDATLSGTSVLPKS